MWMPRMPTHLGEMDIMLPRFPPKWTIPYQKYPEMVAYCRQPIGFLLGLTNITWLSHIAVEWMLQSLMVIYQHELGFSTFCRIKSQTHDWIQNLWLFLILFGKHIFTCRLQCPAFKTSSMSQGNIQRKPWLRKPPNQSGFLASLFPPTTLGSAIPLVIKRGNGKSKI